MPTASDPAGHVITDFSCGVGRLTLNNPARKNAITSSMAEQIAAFCARVEGDESIGAAIIDSVGDYFCSGADTRDLAAASPAPASTEAVARVSVVYDAFVDFGSLPVPTVSLVVGGAVGAGLNLALAADVVLVTPDATLESVSASPLSSLSVSIMPPLVTVSVSWFASVSVAPVGRPVIVTVGSC